jgi:hypothetical protein
MRALLILCTAALLAGCWETAPIVRVPVPVSCVKQRPARPQLVTQAELRVMGDYQAVLALEQHRIRSEAYIGELDAVVDACATVGPSPLP